MEPTIDDLKVGDDIQWEEANGEVREGTVTEVHEDITTCQSSKGGY